MTRSWWATFGFPLGAVTGTVIALFVSAVMTWSLRAPVRRLDRHCTAVKYRIEHDLRLLHDVKATERTIGAMDLDELAGGDDPFLCTGQSMVLVGEPSDDDVAKAAKQIADQIEERP